MNDTQKKSSILRFLKGHLGRRLIFSLCLFLVVSAGTVSFPQEAHAWFWFVMGAGAIATWLGTGGGNEIFNAFLEGIGGLIMNGLSFVFYAFVKIGAYFLYLAGSVFNYALVELVFEYAQNFGNSAAVLASWNVIRDFGNIALLFGFIFIGIATILNLQNYTAKKTLVRLLIFSLLLNFSLFTASLVVDTANVFSYVFYTQAAATECGAGGSAGAETCATTHGLASTIITASGVMGWNDNGSPQVGLDNAADINVGFRNLGAQLAMLIFITVLMIVMFAAAIMLAIRAVVLTFLIITSPFGFVGMVVPFLGSIAKDWWHKLINQSFFAPIYLLLLVISLKIMEGIIAASGTSTLAEALTSNSNNLMGQLVMLITIIAFLIAALIMSKKIGAYGADFAIKTSSGVANTVTGGAGLSVFSSAYRWGAGRTGNYLAKHAGRSTLLRSLPLVGPALQAGIYKRAKDMTKSNVDFRSLASGAIPSASGVSFGKSSSAASGGLAGVRAQREKELAGVYESIKARGPNGEESKQLKDLYDAINKNGKIIADREAEVTKQLRTRGLRGSALTAQTQRVMQSDPQMRGRMRRQTRDIEEVKRIRDQVSGRNEISQREHGEILAKFARSAIMGGGMDRKVLEDYSDKIRGEVTITMTERTMRTFARTMGQYMNLPTPNVTVNPPAGGAPHP